MESNPTEKSLQRAVYRAVSKKGIALIPNVFFFRWESDLLKLLPSGHLVEYEIKLSKEDFKRDAEKRLKHYQLAHADNYKKLPLHFYYLTTRELGESIRVPDYAGLIIYHAGQLFELSRPKALSDYRVSSQDLEHLLGSVTRRFWKLDRYT